MSFVRSNARAELSEFYPPLTVKRRGFGQTTSGAISQGAGTAASLTGSSLGLLTAAGVLQSVPVAGQIAGAVLAITAVVASMFKGCGSQCTLSSDEANKVGDLMTENLNQYMAAPVSRATQAEALANFDQLWQALVNYCNQPSLGAPGQRCISDRQQGSCKYKVPMHPGLSPGGWQQQNGAWVYTGDTGGVTGCWNYFIGMRDPIAYDPRVAALPAAPPASSSLPVFSVAGLNLQSLLFPGLLIGGGLILASLLGDL